MATVYSSEVAVGTYNRIRIKCDYSGTSATLTVQFRRTSARTDTWADSTATLNFDGQNKNAAYSYSGTVGTNWVDLRGAISGYTISISGGTYEWTFNNPGGSSVLGCSGTITIPSQGTAPTGLSATDITPLSDGFSATVSVTGWGGVGDATTRRKSMSIRTYNASSLITPRIYYTRYGNGLSSVITVTNDRKSGAEGDLVVIGNTIYTLSIIASNGTYDTGHKRLGNYVTLAYPVTVTLDSITPTSATFTYYVLADGGYYDNTIEYSIDGGTTWTTLETVTGGNASSGVISLSGLSGNADYTLKIKATTTAGSNISVYYFSTKNVAFYGSVNDEATKAWKLYGSINGETKEIRKLYGSVNGEAKRIF